MKARHRRFAWIGAGVAATYRMDAALTWEPGTEPTSGERVQVHHGTRESPARLAWLGGRFGQLRLEQPLVPLRGDRIVIRQIAPPDTLGGGVVLDASPRRHGPSRELMARLERLERGEIPEVDEDASRAGEDRRLEHPRERVAQGAASTARQAPTPG